MKTGKTLRLTAEVVLLLVFLSGTPVSGAAWNITIIDSDDSVGEYCSLALDSSGKPRISYYDSTNQALKYASWDGSSWNIETVNNSGDVGEYCSLALDSSGKPLISYYDHTNSGLKYASWDGSSWNFETVEDLLLQYTTSLALDSSDKPCISYSDGNLKYASRDGSWNKETVDAGLKLYPALALDSSYNPGIAYYNNAAADDLKYASWNGSGWEIETVDSVGDVGRYPSLAFDSSGKPRISYYDLSNSRLKYASWDSSSWNIEIVDSDGDAGEYNSLALDSSGKPRISYYVNGTTDDLKYAYWDGSSWNIETVDSENCVGRYSSLVLDPWDYPHISYYDATDGNLKYARFWPSPVSGFTASTTSGTAPLTVTFTDSSTSFPTAWYWSFGDGDLFNTTSSSNPSHTYASAGTYTVNLTVSSPGGSDTLIRTDYIVVSDQPTATPTITPTPSETSPPVVSASYGGSNTDTGVGAAEDLKAGETVTFTMDKGSVYMVEITAGTDIDKIMITVQREDCPPGCVDPAGEMVYEYEDVNIYYAGETCLSCGTFDFRVEKNWLSSEGYDSNDIVMMHYNEDAAVWEELETMLKGETGSCYCYSAGTSSFSFFAIIVVEDGTIVPEEKAAPAPTEVSAPVETPFYTVAQTPSAIEAGKASPEKERSLIPVLLPAMFIFLVLVVLIGLANRRRMKKYPDWWWDSGMK